MTKITSIALAATAIFAFGACKNAGYKKTASGLMYKIVKEGSGPQVKIGEFIKANVTQKLNDSVMSNTSGKMPAYIPIDSVGPVYNPSEVLRFVHKGDSVVTIMLADSILAKNPMMAGQLKKGDKIIVSFKVEEIYTKEADVRADRDKEMKKEKDNEIAAIESKLKSKNVTAQKTPQGAYVAIQNPGEGAQADSGKYVSVKYTGKVLDTDTTFDSNMDGKKPLLNFVVGQRQMIPGFDDGVRLLKKGGKATIYIPGFLGYGPQGPGGNDHQSLKFDVEVVDVADKAPAQPQVAPQSAQPHGNPAQPKPATAPAHK